LNVFIKLSHFRGKINNFCNNREKLIQTASVKYENMHAKDDLKKKLFFCNSKGNNPQTKNFFSKIVVSEFVLK